jgi:hypothetical protein
LTDGIGQFLFRGKPQRELNPVIDLRFPLGKLRGGFPMTDLHLAFPAEDQDDADRQRVRDAQQQERIARRELRALKRGLAAILWSASVTPAQRAEFIGLLSSPRQQQIDPALVPTAMSTAEERLVRIHRGLTKGEKALLSGVATLLAERDAFRRENEALRKKTPKKGR